MEDILSRIPHREPFLFVDRVVSENDDKIVTEKQVQPEEPFFAGHYPGRPLMPGVLIMESVFQSGALLMSRFDAGDGTVPVITRVNNVKLKKAVLPGDLLSIEVALKEKVGSAFYMTGLARVGGQKALTLEFTAMLVREVA